MANPRAKVLGMAFAMLALASVVMIIEEGMVGANTWALLALSGVFAAAAVMAFIQNDEEMAHPGGDVNQSIHEQNTEAQTLPDPAEAGFDVPVV